MKSYTIIQHADFSSYFREGKIHYKFVTEYDALSNCSELARRNFRIDIWRLGKFYI